MPVAGKVIALGEAEMDACCGLPWLQRCLYLVLRWSMDRRSGRVGERSAISLLGLANEVRVDAVRGRHTSEAGAPSKKAVRSALDGLARAGLVSPCGNGEVLVFFLPMAIRALPRPNDEGHMRGTDDGRTDWHGEIRSGQGFRRHEGGDEGHTLNGDEGHISRVKVNPISVVAAAAYDMPVDKLSTGLLVLLPFDVEKVAAWLRLQEQRRGRRANVVSSDARLAAWVSAGLSPQQLAEAYALAVADRVATKNRAAINPGFLDVFVRRVLDGGLASRGGGEQGAGEWFDSLGELSRRAEVLGVSRRRHGESFVDFQARVVAAQRKADGQAVARG